MVDQSDADEQHKRAERDKLDALLGWCEATSCRRVALLQYFGENDTPPCGNCDVCLSPPTTWDATVAAQKFLSCVLRTGQRFGAGHVIDVLRGKQTAKVDQHGHAPLSTFGIGADVTENQWRSVTRQLIVRGFLRSDPERYGALVVKSAARALLRGEVTLTLRQETKAVRKRKASAKASELGPADTSLYEVLKDCRKRLAEDAGVPPYVIFHDKTLVEIAARRPSTDAELLELHGVGEAKLEKFGEVFLAAVGEYAGASQSAALPVADE